MDTDGSNRDSCFLAPSHSAPALARRFVSAALDAWSVSEAFPDVALVTSELVTNAVRHAASDLVVSIDLTRERLRVEVSDLSTEHPVMSDLASARDGGWGLHIVERVASRWGLESRADGKTVWCEVANPAA